MKRNKTFVRYFASFLFSSVSLLTASRKFGDTLGVAANPRDRCPSAVLDVSHPFLTGLAKTRVKKKNSPVGFFGFYCFFLGFLGFFGFF
jgi:hypothetical protein